mgnify:CR=1 FL=1
MELNERLAQLRKEHGLSQNDLAEKLNVSRQAISRWEQGLAMPSSDNLIYLSRLYGITLDELIYGKEEIENEQAEEAEEISVPEETDSAKTQTRPWSKKWWVKILFGILILGLVVFFAVGEIENGNVIPLRELTAESLDLTSAEYFSWDDDR